MLFTTWTTSNEMFGKLHIICLIFVIFSIIVGVILGKRFQNKEKNIIEKYIFTSGIILLVLEIAKIAITISYYGYFKLEYIPFQMCSIATYAFILLRFLKPGKINDITYSICTIGLLACGVLYFLKPTAILSADLIALSIQSLLFHLIIIITAMFTLIYKHYYEPGHYKAVLYAPLGFAILSIPAVAINEICYHFIKNGTDVNMFHISAHQPVFYPLLNLIFTEPKPYGVFIIAFWLFLLLCANIIYIPVRIIYTIAKSIMKQH